MAEEIEKLVEGMENVEENVEVDTSTLRENDNQNDIRTRLEPRSNKESPKVKIIVDVQPVNVNEEEEESAEDDYKLRRREKGKHVEDSRNTPSPQQLDLLGFILLLYLCISQTKVVRMIADVIRQERENLRAEISSQINNAISNHIPSQVDSSVRNYMLGHILPVHPTQASETSTQEQQYQLYLTMKDNHQLQQNDLPIWLALKYNSKRLHASDTHCRPSAIHPRDQDDPYDDAPHEGDNSAKR
nr:hypothetical protein [Tanacetum cinerariifolium]GEZ05900.1 hypothetical protein [Tanacetum cinerariifolium]